MIRMNFTPIVVSLLAGAAIGYCFSPSPKATPASAEETKAKETKAARNPDDAAGERSSNRALRARIRELESLLEKQGIEFEKMKTEETDRRERRRDFRADMERIKTEDPARYAQMTNHMAQFRQRRLERAQSKMDFLASVDTSRMSASARKTHEDLIDLIERREGLESKMRDFMEMSEEERHAAFSEMREMDSEIRKLNRIERNNLLRQTAETLGFKGEDAKEITETLKGVIEATDFGFGFGPGGPGRGGPGGPRGPGGGGRRP